MTWLSLYPCRRPIVVILVVAATLLTRGAHAQRSRLKLPFKEHQISCESILVKANPDNYPHCHCEFGPWSPFSSAPMEVHPPAHLDTSMCLPAPGGVSPPNALYDQQHKGRPRMLVSGGQRYNIEQNLYINTAIGEPKCEPKIFLQMYNLTVHNASNTK